MCTHRLPDPLVHAPWTARWWQGDPGPLALFGPAPSDAALDDSLERVRAGTRPASDQPPVVLAGQQPVLAGGPLLVAHKAATAIALARQLEQRWGQPVQAVFLLASHDHDSDEIDHVDVIDPSFGSLKRVKCPMHPRHEAFARSRWDPERLTAALSQINVVQGDEQHRLLDDYLSNLQPDPAPAHVRDLLETTFGPLGLRVVDAVDLEPAGRLILARALQHPDSLRQALEEGAGRLASLDLEPSFEPADSRPLVMESRDGRRRRVLADDAEAGQRLAAQPQDFSPSAALRPVVQAAALPVVAQVCGPSELVYLGQARALHGCFDLPAPVLVPRLEATRVDATTLAATPGGLAALDLAATGRPVLPETADLAQAARRLARAVVDRDPGLAQRARRWLASTEKAAHKLARAPSGGGSSATSFLRPRGRYQDTLLAWLPEAWRAGRPTAWAEHLVCLCRPLDPPVHVLHSFDAEPDDG